jgi:selenocysteine lyase/cysteine desulfurase
MAEEFPSNVLPWKASAGQSGASVVTVPIPRDGEWTRAVVERIDRNTRVVAVSGCHWTNGAAIDLAEVGKAARAVGAALVVDASQSLGARPFSVEQIKPDFLVAAGYKWLLGPYGFALMYVSERWRNARPLEESWLARQGTDDFASLVACSDQYRPGARRFDVGEKCVPTILPGAIAALEQIRSWGIGNIAASLARINARIAVELGTLGFQLPPEAQRCPHMFGALAPKSLARNWVVELRKRDLYISQRGNALRFSPHLHVNDDDLGRLLESLRELAKA